MDIEKGKEVAEIVNKIFKYERYLKALEITNNVNEFEIYCKGQHACNLEDDALNVVINYYNSKLSELKSELESL